MPTGLARSHSGGAVHSPAPAYPARAGPDKTEEPAGLMSSTAPGPATHPAVPPSGSTLVHTNSLSGE